MFALGCALLVFHVCAFDASAVEALQSAWVDPDGEARWSSPGVNTTALSIFEQARLSYEQQYDHYGRSLHDVTWPSHRITLDFEVETLAHVRLSPEALLQRGGVDQGSSPRKARRNLVRHGQLYKHREDDKITWDPPHTIWPNVSKYFTLGVDGTGRKFTSDGDKYYRQELTAQIEIETMMMQPREVVDSSFTDELQSVGKRLHDVGQRDWSLLPFAGAQGIQIKRAAEVTQPCRDCNVQFTVGIVLGEVPSLLAMTTSEPLKNILGSVDAICARRADGCAPEYKAMVSLAAWTLVGAKHCKGCSHPKRCMKPWLVRTHFGDLAMQLKRTLGEHTLLRFPADVMEAAQAKEHDRIYPKGLLDYLRLPEMAELGGLVYPRAFATTAKYPLSEDARDMPTTLDGLLELSRLMLKHRSTVTQRLDARACEIHGRGDARISDLTPGAWLRGILRGKDLMSDHDSPLSKSSFSHLVWKSMGSWRMRPGSNRVYLECRHSDLCLGTGSWPGPAAMIKNVGSRMIEFEKVIQKNQAASQSRLEAVVRHGLRRNHDVPSLKPIGKGRDERISTEISPMGGLSQKLLGRSS